MTGVDFNHIEKLITTHLPDAEVLIHDMTGTRDHLDIMVTSQAFQGKPLIQQHRMIMDILKIEFSNQLHAVKLKTMIK